MQQVAADEYVVDRCTGCGGLWFDLREHEHLAKSEQAVKRLDTGDSALGQKLNENRDISCPVCGVRMLKLAMAGQPHIQYENCPICYGAYFDAREFADYADLTLIEQMRLFFRGFR